MAKYFETVAGTHAVSFVSSKESHACDMSNEVGEVITFLYA